MFFYSCTLNFCILLFPTPPRASTIIVSHSAVGALLSTITTALTSPRNLTTPGFSECSILSIRLVGISDCVLLCVCVHACIPLSFFLCVCKIFFHVQDCVFVCLSASLMLFTDRKRNDRYGQTLRTERKTLLHVLSSLSCSVQRPSDHAKVHHHCRRR